MVRPDLLLNYYPMIRDGRDLIRGQNITLTNTAVIAHPRMIYPAAPMIGHNSAAVGGAVSMPIPAFIKRRNANTLLRM